MDQFEIIRNDAKTKIWKVHSATYRSYTNTLVFRGTVQFMIGLRMGRRELIINEVYVNSCGSRISRWGGGGGRRPPTRVLFSGNAYENERIGSC